MNKKKNTQKMPRIFMGMVEIGGYFGSLYEGFESIGVPCTFVDISNTKRGYENPNKDGCLVKLTRYAQKHFFVVDKLYKGDAEDNFQPSKLKRAFFKLLYPFLKALLFIRYFPTHDVFIFINLTKFLPNYLDLPILKFFGKKIIFVAAGSDFRPPYADPLTDFTSLDNALDRIKKQDEALRVIDKYSDYILGHPSMGFSFKKPFVQWYYGGLPSKLHFEPSFVDREKNSKAVKAFHAPTSPIVKGTAEIVRVIDKLKSKGYEIELIQMTGQPQKEVLKTLSTCDFLIDQLYSDTAMSASVVEAAHMGVPSIVGSYYTDKIRNDIPEKYIGPSLMCHPDHLEEAVKKMIEDAHFRTSLGEKAREFVTGFWSPKACAERYLELINGNAPSDAFFNPEDISYFTGVGLKEGVVQKNIRDIVSYAGESSLCVDDKPNLKARLLEFAGVSKNA